MNQLLVLQRKAIKITYDVSQRKSCDTFFHDLSILPLNVLLQKRILEIMHGIYTYGKPKEMSSWFKVKLSDTNYNIRNVLRFEIPIVKSQRLSSSPIFYFCAYFNETEFDSKAESDKKVFKYELEKYFFQSLANSQCKKEFCKVCRPEEYYTRPRHFLIFKKNELFFRYF